MYPALNTDRSLALFRHPPVTGAYGAVLLMPFEMNVWTSCAGMWVIVIVVLRFLSWMEIRTSDFVATSHEEETVRSWSDTLMIIIGAISEQGVRFSLIKTYAFQTLSRNAMWSITAFRLKSILCKTSGSAGTEYLPMNV